MSNVNESIQDLYNKYPYPKPIDDMEEYLETRDFSVSPTMIENLLWPKTGYPKEKFTILCAGCGSSQAPGLAMNNPLAQVTGIDISDASLSHSEYLKKKHDITNLELMKLDIHDVESLGQKFDIIVSTGVLHHLPDPTTGFQALRKVLSKNGSLVCMLYGAYGRVGVYMYQDLAKLLDLKPDSDSIEILKEMCTYGAEKHPVRLVSSSVEDVEYDAGLVDLFLNPQDTPFTVSDIMEMAEKTDFVFQTWVDNYLYYPQVLPIGQSELVQKISALSPIKQWEFMEIFSCSFHTHSFILTHPDRNIDEYAVDFSLENLDKYIPVWAPYTFVTSQLNEVPVGQVNYVRNGHPFVTNEQGALLFSFMDGKNTAKECIELANEQLGVSEANLFTAFDSLYKMGHIQMRIK